MIGRVLKQGFAAGSGLTKGAKASKTSDKM